MQLAMIVAHPHDYFAAKSLHFAINSSHLSLIFLDENKALESFDPDFHSVVVILLPSNATPLDWIIVLKFLAKTGGRNVAVCLSKGIHKPCVPHSIRSQDTGIRALWILSIMDLADRRWLRGHTERMRAPAQTI